MVEEVSKEELKELENKLREASEKLFQFFIDKVQVIIDVSRLIKYSHRLTIFEIVPVFIGELKRDDRSNSISDTYYADAIFVLNYKGISKMMRGKIVVEALSDDWSSVFNSIKILIGDLELEVDMKKLLSQE